MPSYQCHVCICRALQLDYEGTSVSLLPIGSSDGKDNGDDDDDEYIVYSKLWMTMKK